MLQPQAQRHALLKPFALTQKELRTAVADLYNAMYREGKESKYTFEVNIFTLHRFPRINW